MKGMKGSSHSSLCSYACQKVVSQLLDSLHIINTCWKGSSSHQAWTWQSQRLQRMLSSSTAATMRHSPGQRLTGMLMPRIFRSEEHSIKEQVEAFMRADVIVLTHGSALGNLLFMKEVRLWLCLCLSACVQLHGGAALPLSCQSCGEAELAVCQWQGKLRVASEPGVSLTLLAAIEHGRHLRCILRAH